MEEKDYSLSEQMTDYLTNFAKSSDPNRSGLPMRAPSKNGTLRIGEGEIDMGKVSQIKLWYNMLASKSSGEYHDSIKSEIREE